MREDMGDNPRKLWRLLERLDDFALSRLAAGIEGFDDKDKMDEGAEVRMVPIEDQPTTE